MAIERLPSVPSGASLAPGTTSIPAAGSTAGSAAGDAPAGFGDALGKLIDAVQGSSTEANQAVGRMLDGTGEVHEAMIALQRADVMLQLTVQIRNKLVQAYQDVMRMSV
jgi:flagellar hook-basal body complex protein FliE